MYVGFIILSIIVALIRKGKFSNIKYFRFSMWYLLVAALLIYAAYIVGTIMEVQFVLDFSYWIYFAVYVLVMITVVFNLNNIWSYILVVGIGLNFTATFLNGGKMPILQSALEMAGIKDTAQMYLSYFGATNQLTITDPYVMPLCKILGIPLGVTGLPISAGDIIIAVSIFFIVQKMMVIPQARKATPQERLAYTGQLSYTSEYNLDEIAKATKESSVDLEKPAPPLLSAKQYDTQKIGKSKIDNDILDDKLFIFNEDIPDKQSEDIGLKINSEDDIQDDDEFDDFLQKLDNINKHEDEEELFEFTKADDSLPEQDIKSNNIITGDEEELKEELKEESIIPDYIETESAEEDENIAKLLNDLEQQNFNDETEEQITTDDLQLPEDEEIQDIISELADSADDFADYVDDEEYIEDEKPTQKTDDADEMLSYMLDIFDKHKKAKVQSTIQEDDENAIIKRVLENDESELFISKPKIDLFEDENIYEKSGIQNGNHLEEIDTTNPFVIQNGRIVENPNYKFRKNTETDYKPTEQDTKEEPVIAFDSTQNLEFIRKEIFAELKRQEEAATDANVETIDANTDTPNETNSIPKIDITNDKEESYSSISTMKNAEKEEYERVEFEIDGKTMYVWIKK